VSTAGSGHFHLLEPAVFEFPLHSDAAVRFLDSHDDGPVRQARTSQDHGLSARIQVIDCNPVGSGPAARVLRPRQAVSQIPSCSNECKFSSSMWMPYRRPWPEPRGWFGEAVAGPAHNALLATVLFLQLQGLFQRVSVRLVDLETQGRSLESSAPFASDAKLGIAY